MYIFLDVDGVLNTEDDWSRRVYSLNPGCVTSFCQLLRAIREPKVVLSSTWRNGIARDGTTAVHIKDLLNALAPSGIKTIDRTGIAPDGSRTKEINHYLRRHEKDRYLILDDDPELFDEKAATPCLYLTSSKTGLTGDDVTGILKRIGYPAIMNYRFTDKPAQILYDNDEEQDHSSRSIRGNDPVRRSIHEEG